MLGLRHLNILLLLKNISDINNISCGILNVYVYQMD